MIRASWAACLGGLLVTGCSSKTASPGGGESLTGAWDLTTTQTGESPVSTTLTVGQDTLNVASPSFTLTATRTGDKMTYTDEETPGDPTNDVALVGTQAPVASFDTGILPFNLGGTWTMAITPAGESTAMVCTLSVSPTEIDGQCARTNDNADGFAFSFTTSKTSSASSSFGDFGGTWTNTWTWPEADGGASFPCTLQFSGNTITTCAGTVMNGDITGSPITGITFTYDGADTVSGSAQGWAEFSATRQ